MLAWLWNRVVRKDPAWPRRLVVSGGGDGVFHEDDFVEAYVLKQWCLAAPVARGGAFLIESDKRGDILRHEPRDRSPIRFPTMTISLALCLFALDLARHARRVIYQNLGFAMVVILVLIISALGFKLPLPLGVVAHEGSTVLVCLNGLRMLKFRSAPER